MTIARPVLRPFRPDDGEALAALHRAAILATSDTYTLEERESWAANLRPEGYLNAIQDGEVIEVAIDDRGGPIAFCGRREDNVAALYVHPDWQGHGLGSMLLRRAEAAIAGSGYPMIVIKASISALPFYERCGYQVVQHFGHRTRGGLVLAAAELHKTIAT